MVAIAAPHSSKDDVEARLYDSVDSIDDAIAVATANLGLLPGVAFQARVLQLAHLSNAHKAVCIRLTYKDTSRNIYVFQRHFVATSAIVSGEAAH